MKNGWQTKKLGDVCDFEGGSQPPKSKFIHEKKHGYVHFLQIRDFGSDKNVTYIPESKKNRCCEEGDILIGRYGASVGKILTGKAGAYNVALMKTIPNLDMFERSWFYHYLISDEFQGRLLNVAARSAQDGFSKDDIYNFPVPVPDRNEQRRIIGILDKAFEGIATAKVNAEKNLQNARALFESHLESVFAKGREGWVEKTVAECFKVRSGDFLPAKVMVATGDFDVYGGNGIAGTHDKRNLTGENIIIGRVGAKCGNVRHVEGDLWLTDNAFFISEYFHNFDLRFLARELRRKQLRSTANQAAQPVISYTTIKDVLLEFPISKIEQRRIADRLDTLEEETRRLESLYQSKLTALDALKKSLLHQAFTGAL